MRYVIHSQLISDTLKCVEADNEESAILKSSNILVEEFQKSLDEVLSVSEVPEDYDFSADAKSKGYQ